MILKDFKNLMQKLALQMWNKCVPVFEAQRKKNIQKSSQIFKLQSSEGHPELNNLTLIDLEHIQQIFVLESVKILGPNEIPRTKQKKKKKDSSPKELQPEIAEQKIETSREPVSLRKLMDYADNTRVKEIFSYRENEVKVECQFQTLLEVFQD